jgi:hypothetical protein
LNLFRNCFDVIIYGLEFVLSQIPPPGWLLLSWLVDSYFIIVPARVNIKDPNRKKKILFVNDEHVLTTKLKMAI